jgi:hypothetical protein
MKRSDANEREEKRRGYNRREEKRQKYLWYFHARSVVPFHPIRLFCRSSCVGNYLGQSAVTPHTIACQEGGNITIAGQGGGMTWRRIPLAASLCEYVKPFLSSVPSSQWVASDRTCVPRAYAMPVDEETVVNRVKQAKREGCEKWGSSKNPQTETFQCSVLSDCFEKVKKTYTIG